MTAPDDFDPGQERHENQSRHAGVDLSEYRTLKVWAEMFHDAQQARIRSANRISNAPVFPDLFASELAEAEKTEHRIRLALRRQYRRAAPAGVIAWQKESKGIGEDILARLLGHLGHPRVATPSHWEGSGDERKLVPDPPFARTVGELWQFCGHGRPGRPSKGMSAEELFALGNPQLKMLVHVLAECAIKQPGRSLACAQASVDPHDRSGAGDLLDPGQRRPDAHMSSAGVDPSTTPPIERPTPTGGSGVWPYRQVYEQRRTATVDRAHQAPCVRCGPSGHPAAAGTPWSAGHQHADALRIVGKEILRDIWKAAE
ncbi:hypothetical protein K6U06_06455 [Acidiferrimicrobium sp. IK]|uniref:hypothetical protein n=1 Tax=Acidiferrimicrobium sp. IK TaxID=2871700 RepID=UPI0021CB2038|nr:hypothetical protein [Acidiferrimicrobium sp. IK]MCU4183994.1 hypothetical protein [Acidiferrimicrobium sp. IK]